MGIAKALSRLSQRRSLLGCEVDCQLAGQRAIALR